VPFRACNDLLVTFVAWERRFLGRYSRLLLGLLVLAFGLLTLSRARHDPGGSFAGASTLGAIAELAAGWGLVAAGLVFWERHRGNRCGPLVVAAGFAWFLPEWTSPGVATAIGFTVGLLGAVACSPLVGHAALAYPTGRLKTLPERATVAVAYAGALLLLGVLPTTVYDPRATGCFQCSRNLALARGNPGLYSSFEHYGLRIGIGWLAALGLLLAWRLARASRAGAQVSAPVVAPAVAYLGLVLWDFQHSLATNIIGNDNFDVRTWRYEALCLVLVALGVGWGLHRERRSRGAVAELVLELGRAPRPGALRDALAEALGDPSLEVAYRRPGSEDYVNAAGLSAEATPGPGQSVTPLLRGDTQVAALVHDARLTEQPGLIEEVVSAARLALQNEQLQAEVRAQLEELRASRARIVNAADAERRRLERDLHDGAQQRIVALSLALQLLRARLGPDPDAELETRIGAAQEKLRQGLAALRELAHGIYPAVLGDEGLAAAMEVLAEQAEVPIRLEGLTEDRFQAAVENAAYFTVVEAISGAAEASISIEQEEGCLVVRVRSSPNGAEPDRLEIVDRVGALDGSVTVLDGEIRAEIPCGS
jgi:signal transduction histidine kinase